MPKDAHCLNSRSSSRSCPPFGASDDQVGSGTSREAPAGLQGRGLHGGGRLCTSVLRCLHVKKTAMHSSQKKFLLCSKSREPFDAGPPHHPSICPIPLSPPTPPSCSSLSLASLLLSRLPVLRTRPPSQAGTSAPALVMTRGSCNHCQCPKALCLQQNGQQHLAHTQLPLCSIAWLLTQQDPMQGCSCAPAHA